MTGCFFLGGRSRFELDIAFGLFKPEILEGFLVFGLAHVVRFKDTEGTEENREDVGKTTRCQRELGVEGGVRRHEHQGGGDDEERALEATKTVEGPVLTRLPLGESVINGSELPVFTLEDCLVVDYQVVSMRQHGSTGEGRPTALGSETAAVVGQPSTGEQCEDGYINCAEGKVKDDEADQPPLSPGPLARVLEDHGQRGVDEKDADLGSLCQSPHPTTGFAPKGKRIPATPESSWPE